MGSFNNYYINERPAYISQYEIQPSLDKNILYISPFTKTIYIKNLTKEVENMEFNLDKIKSFYQGVLTKRDDAVSLALLNKEEKIAERFEQVKAEIEEQVIAEITKEAEAPFVHDIELCEQFLADEKPAEEEKEIEDENL